MSDLGHKVLREIERQKLRPKPVLYFMARRWIMWCMAFAAAVLGALCVAFGWFASHDFAITGGKGVDQMPFDDIAVMLPAFAMVAYALLVFSAAAVAARTGRGYLLGIWRWLTITLAASLALGVALIALDAGPQLHALLQSRFPAYKAYSHIPYEEWSQPQSGMLGGSALAETPTRLTLRDFRGKVWDVDISSVQSDVEGSLVEEGDLALRGAVTGPDSFRATSIEPFD